MEHHNRRSGALLSAAALPSEGSGVHKSRIAKKDSEIVPRFNLAGMLVSFVVLSVILGVAVFTVIKIWEHIPR